MISKENRSRLIELMFVVLVSTVVGMVSGGAAIFTMLDVKEPEYSYVENNSDLSEVNSVYEDIISKYYKVVDKNALITGAIDGMISVLGDPNSSYFDNEEAASFNDRLNGKYVGVGLEIMADGTGKILVVGIFEGSPASKSKIKEGDYILEVDGVPVSGITAEETASKIKRELGEEAVLTIERDGETFKETIASGNIVIKSVESQIFKKNNKNVGYIKLDIFAANTEEQFTEELKKLEKQKINSLIIDVRNNSGGYLTSVTDILERFLPKGTILYKTRDAEGTIDRFDTTSEKRSYKVVVLTNEVSASASEILAVTLSEKYGAILVGKKTYGKGTVQQVLNTASGGFAKITTQEWFSPEGNEIDKVGVVPKYDVDMDYNKYDTAKPETDTQLQKALEVIVK